MSAGVEARLDAAVPKVSVAIASFNYGRYLDACVRSALTQPGIDLEVVIVDDASTDDSADIALKLAREDSRVKVTVHEKNHGHIETFNESLWLATGEFVVKLDSDDMLTPGALRRGAAVLQALPHVGMVYGNPLTFENEVPPARTSSTGTTVWEGTDWLRRRCVRATNCIMQPEVMVRRTVLHRTDGHRAAVPAAHDLNLWLRIAAMSDVARIRGADQGYYRVHSQSLLRTTFAGYLSDLQQRRAAFDDFYATCDASTATRIDRDALRLRTHRRLAIQAVQYAMRNYSHLGQVELSSYLDFANEVWPAANTLPQWRGLERRERFVRAEGPLAAQHFFKYAEAIYGAQDSLRWRLWRRYGT
ncbi:glycosyltransferase family 2 protein [Pseudarthrobacter phenanthrenivorans]|uniref:glycosyltransferase family 2 protein n=1 Tax=Pseudarthrobacter phenanthrenivorans TaxID=361575 RepID=UPI0015E84157|nr:glycosyltransferase family A protein [Pseudarthrobacter phenanthrenivorans]